MMRQIGAPQIVLQKPPGQTSGERFEVAVCSFLTRTLGRLGHVRPGQFLATRGRAISAYAQYSHLDEIAALARDHRELQVALGADYLIRPDIVVGRTPIPDHDLNAHDNLVGGQAGRRSTARDFPGALPIMLGSVSCKLTIRSDRVQNTRSEALNLVRNRKGRLPNIVAVTAEPLPGRIRAIALGTGDLDCVYHFALDELLAALNNLGDDELGLIETLVEGKRLRDIADLPLDLLT